MDYSFGELHASFEFKTSSKASYGVLMRHFIGFFLVERHFISLISKFHIFAISWFTSELCKAIIFTSEKWNFYINTKINSIDIN